MTETVIKEEVVEDKEEETGDSRIPETEVSPLRTACCQTSSTGSAGCQTASSININLSEACSLEFNPNLHIQSILQTKLVHHEKAIFVAIVASALAFKFVFGSLALGTLVMWLMICIVLTKLRKLSSKHYLSASSSRIEITSKDWLGKEPLSLPWDKIELVEYEPAEDFSTIEIRLKTGAISHLQSLLFRDIINSRSTIACHIKTQESGKESLQAFLQMCPQNCVVQKLPPANHEIEPVVNDDEIIPYQPLHRFQSGFSHFLNKADRFLLIALSIIVLAALFFIGARSSFLALTWLLIPLLLAIFAIKEKALGFFFTDKGITLNWTALGRTDRSNPIPWSAVQQVCYTARSNSIDILINDSHECAKHIKLLWHLAPGVFRFHNKQARMTIELDGIRGSGSKQNLLSSIRRYLPAEQIDPAIAEALNPTDVASYTKLWLDCLGSRAGARRFEGKLESGRQLKNGRFKIAEFLGAGGQANVYLASQDSSENSNDCSSQVVLKEFILPSHAGADLSIRSLEHIEKELELMKKLQHPNIVKYHDIFVEDHRCYLVLEYVKGRSLRSLVEEQGVLSQTQALTLAGQMAEILKHLHSQIPPVVHRDFTPENLILDGDGTLKLIDFNVAQELEEESTRTIVGKHGYLPPEQFRGKACPQSDIYAFGATLFFLLTAEDPEPISCSHPIVKNESVSKVLDQIVASATELELSNRFKSADEVLKAVASCADYKDSKPEL